MVMKKTHEVDLLHHLVIRELLSDFLPQSLLHIIAQLAHGRSLLDLSGGGYLDATV